MTLGGSRLQLGDVVEMARDLELEVKSVIFFYVSELLQSHDKTLMDEELLLMDEQRKWFLEMEPNPVEDSVRIAKMTTNIYF